MVSFKGSPHLKAQWRLNDYGCSCVEIIVISKMILHYVIEKTRFEVILCLANLKELYT
jgi:hypothetical protein